MTEPGLFSNATTPSADSVSRQGSDVTGDSADRSAKVQRSALWAAYGDALGWISELTDADGLRKRTAGIPLRRPIEWTRRIGGRAGVTISLPRGCYSDDSQLRLATGRAIHPDGFDVEAFAKVELPIWPSYALGGGKSTTAAAINLTKPKVSWFANTFKDWTKSGGNGAAMRIQPHVWSARTLDDPEEFLPDVIRNAICTHSHPTGLMGAILHALALAHALASGCHPSSDDLLAATNAVASLPAMMQNDTEIGTYWRAAFEREAGIFNDAWAKTIDECREAIRVAGAKSSKAGVDRYSDIVERLGLRDPTRRGSGMLTAVAAVGLIWCEARPEEALSIAANAIGTDTDTIATMAGAVLGITTETEPPIEVLDMELFRSEAARLAKIAQGEKPECHRYPDLLHWSVPKARADRLTRTEDGGLYVRGLGYAKALGDPIAKGSDNFAWQWLKLETGQTLLMKHRRELACDGDNASVPRARQSSGRPSSIIDNSDRLGVHQEEPSLDLQLALYYMAQHKDDDKLVGAALRRVVNKGTPGQIAAFTATLIDCLRQSGASRQSSSEKQMAMYNPPHPGESIRERMEAVGWTVTECAKRLNTSHETLSQLLDGRGGISPTLALALERIGWSKADHWMRRQVAYDLARERRRQAA